MFFRGLAILLCVTPLCWAVADDLIYRYEGDVVPYDESAGWEIFNPCDSPCTESVEEGHFVLRWPFAGNFVNYHYWIAQSPEPPPATLWVEWRFRSNHPLGQFFFSCDAKLAVEYEGMFESVNMYGDAAISRDGGSFLLGLDIDDFHTYRFESLDGMNYWIAVDGQVFIDGFDDNFTGNNFLQLRGIGGCISDQIPNMVNEWDFVRYGTISHGEQIISSDPPDGFVDARAHAPLDRFIITYDSPNYAYIDDITVEVSGGDAPIVLQTSRCESDEPDTLEIVLDRPIAMGETTRFIFNDGTAVNVIEYTIALGDTDGDGDADLHDFATFQRCVGQTPPTGPCLPLDLNGDNVVDLLDFEFFHTIASSP